MLRAWRERGLWGGSGDKLARWVKVETFYAYSVFMGSREGQRELPCCMLVIIR